MKPLEVRDWGSNTIGACRDIVRAHEEGYDIILHEGSFNPDAENHLSAISRACVGSDIELVLKGVEDPEVVYPHITFIEES